MLKKKAVFIGGLTNGYEALKIILESKKIDLELIVTYPKKSSNIPVASTSSIKFISSPVNPI